MIADPLTGEEILTGSTRHVRPNEYLDGPEQRCAFCPGNEDLTPHELARVGDARMWRARAFRNKYPAIEPPAGDHEVIVDAPDHRAEVTLDGGRLWRERYADVLGRFPSSYPVLFKNSGAYAGATLVHPHTQLIVIPHRPKRWTVADGAACLLCAERERARADDMSIIEGRYVDAFVRKHARFAFALTVLPHACRPSLLDATADAWAEALAILHRAIEGLRAQMGASLAFNLLAPSEPHAQSFHWHFELIARTNTLAGFELSTGIFIRGATAQESAARWRRMIAPPDGPL